MTPYSNDLMPGVLPLAEVHVLRIIGTAHGVVHGGHTHDAAGGRGLQQVPWGRQKIGQCSYQIQPR